MASFMSLSPELRDIIYKLSLVTDELIIPYLSHWQLDLRQPVNNSEYWDEEMQVDKPKFLKDPSDTPKVSSHLKREFALGLLYANRLISAESKEVLYHYNI